LTVEEEGEEDRKIWIAIKETNKLIK